MVVTGNNTLYDRKNKFSFSIVSNITIECGKNKILMYLTSSRHFLSEDKIWFEKNITVKSEDLISAYGFMVAEQDASSRQFIKQIQTLSSIFCQLELDTLAKLVTFKDVYFSLRFGNGKEMIVYVKDEILYLPHCVPVSVIEIITSVKNCYRDIAIRFTVNNRTISGFLTSNNILITVSKLVDCSFSRIIEFKNIEEEIKIQGNSYKLQNKSGYLMHTFHLTNFNGEEVNLQHSHLVFDLPDDTLSRTGETYKLYEHEFYALPPQFNDHKPTMIEEFKTEFIKNLNPYKETIYYIFFSFVSFIILLIILYICIKFNCCIVRQLLQYFSNKFCEKKKPVNTPIATISMNTLPEQMRNNISK